MGTFQSWEPDDLAVLIPYLRVLFRDENAIWRERVTGTMLDTMLPMLADILSEGVRQGVFAIDDPETAAEVTIAIWHGIYEKVNRPLLELGGHPESLPEVMRRLRAVEVAVERTLGIDRDTLRLYDFNAIERALARVGPTRKVTMPTDTGQRSSSEAPPGRHLLWTARDPGGRVEDLSDGRDPGACPARGRPRDRSRRVPGDRRPLRLGQDHPAQSPRRHRLAERGPAGHRRHRRVAVRLEGVALFRREKIGFIFQFFNLIPTLTARENVDFALDLAGRDGDRPTRDAAELLDRVGLGDRLDHFPLSSRVESSSASPSPGRWPRIPSSCSAMSPPATSTSAPASSCSVR